jgi:hypothetical protein
MGEKIIISKTEEVVLKETKYNKKKDIILEYYVFKNSSESKNYGIKIIKKEKMPDGSLEFKESYIREDIGSKFNKVGELINTLARNKVTPITADNIFDDLGT